MEVDKASAATLAVEGIFRWGFRTNFANVSLALEEAAVVALIPWAPIEIVAKTCAQYDLYGYDAISNCYREAQVK